MKDVVFLIRNVAEGAFGGGEMYQLNLAKMLKKNGFEPVILTSSRELIRRAKEEGCKVLVPPYIERQNWSGKYNLLLPIYVLKIRKMEKWYERKMLEYRPRVVNIESRDEWIAATLAAKKTGVKILWTDHADFSNWVMWNVNAKGKNLIGKLILKLSKEVDKVIFVSEKVAQKTMRMIKPWKIKNAEVINNGVFDKREKYKKIKCQPQSFVFVGRVAEEKGLKELMEAFRMVRDKYPSAMLNIYGDGDIEKYRGMAGKGVRFHGATDEPLRAMAENEIFVLPSYREGLSLSLLEAAMMGKKIIASDVDGNPEVIEDGVSGILVPAKNVEKLAEAMTWMLDNPKAADKMAQEARKNYEEKFNFEKIFAEKMLPLYNSGKE